jgi:predicted nucleotidyltransferase
MDTDLLNEITRQLAAEFQAEAIFLFGSQTWGLPDSGSDFDLLVVISDSQETPTERAWRAQRSLRGLLVPVDVLVRTRAEFDRYRSVYASLEAQVFEKGKLIYGSKTRAGKKLVGQSRP